MPEKEQQLWPPFLVATFFITWVIGIPIIILLQIVEDALKLPDQSLSNLIPEYGPTIGGLFVIGYYLGKPQLIAFIKRALEWRVSPVYYLFAFLFPYVLHAHLFLFAEQEIIFQSFNSSILLSIVLAFLNYFLLGGGMGEEFGWRGVMLPDLIKRCNPLVTSLIIGFFWWLWHLPAFAFGDQGKQEPLLPFTLFVFAVAVVMTWLFYRTKKSVLIAAIFHGSVNATGDIIRTITNVEKSLLEEPLYVWGQAIIMTAWALLIILIHGKQLGYKKTPQSAEIEVDKLHKQTNQ